VLQRILYKTCLFCYKCLHGSAPSYLADDVQRYTPSRNLRSSSDTLLLTIPRYKLSSVGSRSFSVFGPTVWNSLPLSLRSISNINTFKANLKAHFFTKVFS
jgi:hypothetical protein